MSQGFCFHAGKYYSFDDPNAADTRGDGLNDTRVIVGRYGTKAPILALVLKQLQRVAINGSGLSSEARGDPSPLFLFVKKSITSSAESSASIGDDGHREVQHRCWSAVGKSARPN